MSGTSKFSRAGAALHFMRPPAKVEVIDDINGELGREAARKDVIIFSWDEAPQPVGLF